MKKKNVLICIVCCLGLIAPAGCYSGKHTSVDSSAREDFTELKAPPLEDVKARAQVREFRFVDHDEIWVSILKVVMQNGAIIESNAARGVLVLVPNQIEVSADEPKKNVTGSTYVGPAPLAIYSLPGESKVYLYPMIGSYESMWHDNAQLKEWIERSTEAFSKRVLDMIATQVYASQKWRYLR